MSNKQFLKSPLILFSFSCFVLAGVTLVFFPQKAPVAVQGIAQKNVPTRAITATSIPTVTPVLQEQKRVSTPQTSSSAQIAPTTVVQSAAQISATPITSGQASPQNKESTAKMYNVTLSINGSSVGNVEIPEGSNQCDVLSKAKDQGKISSLLMKFDNSLGTNGVYQINGIGKENAVWWVYKVNGQSPGQGCSLIKANNGDAVGWEYKG